MTRAKSAFWSENAKKKLNMTWIEQQYEISSNKILKETNDYLDEIWNGYLKKIKKINHEQRKTRSA